MEKKKAILFDLLCAQPMNGTKFHGGGEYTKTIFHSFLNHRTGKKDFEVLAFYDKDKFIDKWIVDYITENNIRCFDIKSVENVSKLLLDLCNEYDLSFYAGMGYGYESVSFPKGIKTFATFHGLRQIEILFDKTITQYMSSINDYKLFIYYTFFKKRLIKRLRYSYEKSMEKFNVIFTVSNFSKYSIMINFPNIYHSKSIYAFYPPLKYNEQHNSFQDSSDKNYIMMISGNRWLKNCYRGILSIDSLYSKGFLSKIRTVIYGGVPKRIQKQIKNKCNFMFFDYVSSSELEEAYKNCSLFFYPTLNEGFGSPPLEAMKYGKTCLISSVSSLPEVYGDSVYYCNPYDLGEMENKILYSINNKIEKEIVIRRAKYLFEKQHNDTICLVDMICE